MALKGLLGGILAVLLMVLVVFNVVMPAMTVVTVILADLIRGRAVAVPSNLTMPTVAAALLSAGLFYFWESRRRTS